MAECDAVRVESFRASFPTAIRSAAMPHASVTVLIELSSTSSSVGEAPLGALCVGLQSQPVPFAQHGEVDCVEIRLTPSQALSSGLLPGELVNRVVRLDAIANGGTIGLIDRLHSTPVSERADLVRREFRSLWPHQPSSKVSELIRRLEHVNPSRPVGDLIDDLGGSRSRMWRTATAALGMSPKRFLMLRRFEVGTRLLSSGVPLAAAAVRAGYVDQAHFHREVERWAGHTPGELLRRVDATYVQDGNPDPDP